MKRVFVDASCLYAAAASPTGGSSRILALAGRDLGEFIIQVSDLVLDEARRNIVRALGEPAYIRLVERLYLAGPDLVPAPTAAELTCWRGMTADKDLHVLASAVKGRAHALVTLDRRHLLTARVRADFPIPVMDTKGFLTAFLAEK